MDDQLFTLYWFPNPEIRDEQDVVFQSICVEEVFRFYNAEIGSNRQDWRFDGDGFHTTIDLVRGDEVGGYLITRW